MNAGTDTQILAAYNQGLSPEEIANDLSFPLYAVKAKLMALSADYRKECGAEPEHVDERNLSSNEQVMIKNKLMNTFLNSEDEHVIVKLGLALRDDGLGRKDVVKQMQGTIGTMNILQLVNSSLSQAREGAMKLREGVGQKKVVNV